MRARDEGAHRGACARDGLRGHRLCRAAAARNAVRLLHVCGRYLPLSEIFTYDLITGLNRFKHHVVANALENVEHFPFTGVVVPQPEEQAWALAKQIDASAVVCHVGPQATLGMTIALAIDRPAVTIFHDDDISRLLRDRLWIERYRAVASMGMQ